MMSIPAILACEYAYDQAYLNRGRGKPGGYIWGAMGEKVTEAMLVEWARRVGGPETSQGKTIMEVGRKWLGKYAWDCSGLFRAITKELLKAYKSGGATTLFNTLCTATGRIGSMPDIAGIAVFRAKAGSDTQMAHVGLYIGNGMVVHARGTSYGVVYEHISKHAWTHWGAVEYIDLGQTIEGSEPKPMNKLYDARVDTKSSPLNLWSSSAKTRSLIQVPRHAIVEVLDREAPKGWAYAGYKGVAGYADAQYLTKIAGSEPAPEAAPPVTPPAGLGKGVYVPQAAWDAMMAAAVAVGGE